MASPAAASARILLFGLTALFGAVTLSCSFAGRLFTGNSAALFRAPRAVANKVRHPYRPDARLAVLWVGHATALIQIDDKLILTDPVFTSTVGALSSRLVEPGLDPEDLPPVDAVLISHMHFDHLSLGSLSMIEPKIRILFVPRGGLVYVPNFSFDSIEVPLWSTWEHGGLRITAVPVKHSGFRYGADQAWMTMSYTGYVIEYHGLSVYFGGDTAYQRDNFVRTRARFPSLDLALLPIAPIHPREHMRSRHVDPAEAVQAFMDLGARRMVPIHFDTFINGMDAPGEALQELRRVVAERGLSAAEVPILGVGEQRVLIPRSVGPAP
jgi:N-acyl-phosphatidylethanolamine-hydrolysing phospholipase D